MCFSSVVVGGRVVGGVVASEEARSTWAEAWSAALRSNDVVRVLKRINSPRPAVPQLKNSWDCWERSMKHLLNICNINGAEVEPRTAKDYS